jgi:hypothetical protein
MNMIRLGQINQVEKGDIRAQAEYARSNFWSDCITRSSTTKCFCAQIVFATQPDYQMVPKSGAGVQALRLIYC